MVSSSRATRRLSAGLFYIFCDEQKFDRVSDTRFVTGHFAVPQDAWSRLTQERRALVEPRNVSQAQRIQKLLADLDGVAVITDTVIPRKYMPLGERDATGDIESMARPDHIWSVTMAYGIVATLKWLELENLVVKTVDGYYDSKSLTQSHRKAWTNTITVQIRQSISDISRNKTRVRRFCEVEKPKSNTPTKFQAGTMIADRLLEYAPEVIALRDSRVGHCDHSQRVISYIKEKFT